MAYFVPTANIHHKIIRVYFGHLGVGCNKCLMPRYWWLSFRLCNVSVHPYAPWSTSEHLLMGQMANLHGSRDMVNLYWLLDPSASMQLVFFQKETTKVLQERAWIGDASRLVQFVYAIDKELNRVLKKQIHLFPFSENVLLPSGNDNI